MHLPPLQPPIAAGYCVSGAVVIAPDAIVAPGVVLMADPNSQITIASGACLGLGVILHANGGGISIESGATLGAGVLIVGTAVVGSGATIGPSTTLYNASVARHQIVSPGSLLGERDRTVASANAPWAEESGEGSAPRSAADTPHQAEPTAPAEQTTSTVKKTPGTVYGKDAFLQMRSSMFPL